MFIQCNMKCICNGDKLWPGSLIFPAMMGIERDDLSETICCRLLFCLVYVLYIDTDTYLLSYIVGYDEVLRQRRQDVSIIVIQPIKCTIFSMQCAGYRLLWQRMREITLEHEEKQQRCIGKNDYTDIALERKKREYLCMRICLVGVPGDKYIRYKAFRYYCIINLSLISSSAEPPIPFEIENQVLTLKCL